MKKNVVSRRNFMKMSAVGTLGLLSTQEGLAAEGESYE